MSFLSRLHWTRDLAGYCCFSFVIFYWVYGNFSIYKLILIPYVQQSVLPSHSLIVYGFFSVMTMLSLLRATFSHPGKFENDPYYHNIQERESWPDCVKCYQKKPPRAHHCSKCRHCVTKMDHHCPWINNCVGADNQFAFMLLCYYTMGLTVSAFMFCMMKIYKLPPCDPEICNPELFVFQHINKFMYLSIAMSVVMFLGITMLSCGQHMSVAMDVTTMETMFAPDAAELILSRPYAPLFHRYKIMCGTNWKLLWLWPLRKRHSFMDNFSDNIPNSNPLHIV